jgi:hypothetical protein
VASQSPQGTDESVPVFARIAAATSQPTAQGAVGVRGRAM